MLTLSDIKILAERIAQLSDNHRKISESLKNISPTTQKDLRNDTLKERSESGIPTNIFPLNDLTKQKSF